MLIGETVRASDVPGRLRKQKPHRPSSMLIVETETVNNIPDRLNISVMNFSGNHPITIIKKPEIKDTVETDVLKKRLSSLASHIAKTANVDDTIKKIQEQGTIYRI